MAKGIWHHDNRFHKSSAPHVRSHANRLGTIYGRLCFGTDLDSAPGVRTTEEVTRLYISLLVVVVIVVFCAHCVLLSFG